jgi:hypothetical protein
MASRDSHIVQWKHNREFICTISADYPDWIVTACFYVGVHAIDTLLAHDKIYPTSHDYRNEVLVKTNRYSLIYRAYNPLYTLSRTVRYFANPKDWIRFQDLQPKVIERYLYPLEKSVQNLIGIDLGLPKILLSQQAPFIQPQSKPAHPSHQTPVDPKQPDMGKKH